ncbi:unannotated protein [freshwater metagenome]|uniref:NAD(+) synthase (glutamine-hydrolyzing) n=1 Tax=freshwater metagenome TaxID=449393 RepID=A0A6J7XT96_9ZZZZ|nr:NAD+ synthase [Actinomycetota bacterium]
MKLRLAMAQINPLVGDLEGNSQLVISSVTSAAQSDAHVVVFPEMVLTGYPVEDLATRLSFQQASATRIKALAGEISHAGYGDIVAVIGYLDHSERGPLNALAIVHEGEIKARYIKQHLPNYGVFDEYRTFAPGKESLIVRINGIDVGFLICEDIWQDGGAVAKMASRHPGLLLVPNGSPFERNKDDIRLALVKKRAQEIGAPLAYVNMTGGQDDLVFDGDTIVVDRDGTLLARAAQFEDVLMMVDLDLQGSTSTPDLVISTNDIEISHPVTHEIATRLGDIEEVWQALVIGLRDYVEKNGFRSVVIGLSGGIDSALVAAIAIDALGAKRVNGVALPSRYSSHHSVEDAQTFATNTGIHFRIVEIAPMVDAFMNNLILKGIAEENLQARVRGTTLMGISNQEGHLVLATGNKSELAVGYSTLYGDAVGGFAPIKDIYKVDVWALARWRNEKALRDGETPPIPENSIAKEPSAELRPDQKDSDSLPDYFVLDEILLRYVDGDEGLESLLASGLDGDLVRKIITMVDRAEYKRRQYPPGTKVSSRAFGKDRRLPMTSRWQEGSQ